MKTTIAGGIAVLLALTSLSAPVSARRKTQPIRKTQSEQREKESVTVTEEIKVVEETPRVATVKSADKGRVFTAVEQQAEFPGGSAALMRWIAANLRYPERAQQNDIEGRVIVKFVVNTDGSIEQASILKGVDKDLDAEALRVVRHMPRWHPAKNNGEPVRSYYTLPVTFKLTK